MGSALALNPEDYEIDSRVVYYELDLEAIGIDWEQQVTAITAFQNALQQKFLLGSTLDIT